MKALEATCVAGVVKVGVLPIPTAVILSEGSGTSSGVLILDRDQATYIARTAPDLKATLEKLATALTQIATALTTLDAKPIGTLPSAPAAGPAISQISSIQAELIALKGILK